MIYTEKELASSTTVLSRPILRGRKNFAIIGKIIDGYLREGSSGSTFLLEPTSILVVSSKIKKRNNKDDKLTGMGG